MSIDPGGKCNPHLLGYENKVAANTRVVDNRRLMNKFSISRSTETVLEVGRMKKARGRAQDVPGYVLVKIAIA